MIDDPDEFDWDAFKRGRQRFREQYHLDNPVIQRETFAWHEARRVRGLKRRQREQLQVLAIWCETGRCCVGRVYRLRAGLLLDCRGEADLREWASKPGTRWGKNSTVWLDEQKRDSLPITCDCTHTASRKVTIAEILAVVDEGRRSVGVSDLSRG